MYATVSGCALGGIVRFGDVPNTSHEHLDVISRTDTPTHRVLWFRYLQGSLTFEKDATFSGNVNDQLYYGSGPGGAISVHVKGSIYFMGKLTMTDNEADVRFFRD